MTTTILIAHNIRSVHNIGSILRTADGFGVAKVYCTGCTPYPAMPHDSRPPHIRDKVTRHIHKTALGAEQTVPCEYVADPLHVIQQYRQRNFTIAALEQDPHSVSLSSFRRPDDLVLLLGEEVHGVTANLRQATDVMLEIAMHGRKESFNVSVATGIALYALAL